MSKNKKLDDHLIQIFTPFGQHPQAEEINISEFEDIWEYDSKLGNIVNTGQQKNLQVEIDSYKDQSLIYNILDKYIGISNPEDFKNIPELNKKEGFYADISDLPNNIHDLKKLGELAQIKLEELNKQEMERQNNDMENQTLFGNETNLQEIEKTGQGIKEGNEKDIQNK